MKFKMLEWLNSNKERKKESDRLYRINNWEKIKKRNAVWRKKDYQKLKNDPNRSGEWIHWRVKSNVSRRIRGLLFELKTNRTMEYIGCSMEQLRQHLESQFTDGMSWDNYGEWQIDHILPCDAFDLTVPFEVFACFNYRNLQPLMAKENIAKKNKFCETEFHNYMSNFQQIYAKDNNDEAVMLELMEDDNEDEEAETIEYENES